MMRYITFILFFLPFSVFGQMDYQLDTISQKELENYIEIYRKSNQRLILEIKNKYPKKIAKKLIKNINEYEDEFEKSILNKDFIFDKRFLSEANNILNELKSKNPEIPKNINLLISKDPSLNAYCLPDGTFVLNIGLFYWLHNKDQIAGIMSHELSHYLLNHSIKRQLQQIEAESSKHKKKQLKSVKRSRFNKSKKAFDLYKNLLYANRKNRRKNEIEADSLGYLLIKNTKYKPSELIKSLKLVKVYDTIRPKDLNKEIYTKIFNLPNLKFYPKWLQLEDYSDYHYELYNAKLDLDSIATHPDVIIRVKKLQTLLNDNSYKQYDSQPDKEFLKLNKLTEYNLIPNLMHFDQIGVSIYLCLKQLQEGNDEKYYKKLLGKNFKIILEARKKYQLNRYIERPNPKKQSRSYLQFLNFLWNLNLSEIEKIAEYYNNQ